MKPKDGGSAVVSDEAGREHERSIQGLHGVRYQSTDVNAPPLFTPNLGFTLEHQKLPAFAPCPSVVSSPAERPGRVRLAADA